MDIKDQKRLIGIILILYNKDPELVIHVINQYKHWNERDEVPTYHLCINRINELEITFQEGDWLIEQNIVEFDSGNNDSELSYHTHVYRMTNDSRIRLRKILVDIVAKQKQTNNFAEITEKSTTSPQT